MASPRTTSGITTSITTLVGMTLTLTMMGCIAALYVLGKGWEKQLRQEARVQVYFQRELDAQALHLAQEALRTDPAVAEARYLDPAEASRELEQELGESFVDFLGYVPLPDVMDLTMRPEFGSSEALEEAVARMREIPGVSEVVWQADLLAGIETTIQRLVGPMALMAALFLVVAVALLHNTIRLTVFARRFIIKTMQLVGAHPRLIRRPFLVQGAMLGVVSGLFSFALVTGLMAFVRSIAGELLLHWSGMHMLALAGGLVGLGALLGWISTVFAVNRYLRMEMDRLY
jgi:cell division transport system permease protein